MKIKIIDLLNMRARNEEMPKHIRFCEHTWNYLEFDNDYESLDIDNWLFQDFIPNNLDLLEILNDEVEITEEEKKINKFDIEFENDRYRLKFNSCSYSLNEINYIILSKLNEVIDAVNKLKVDD